MPDQITKAQDFAKLHVSGDPLIIYNAWDGGSARAIESAGAKAIAVGDHPVGFAHGYGNDDFKDFTFNIYMTTIKDILRAIELPFSVDISNGEGLDNESLKARVKLLMDNGVIGINFEDRLDDSSGIKTKEEQVDRIAAIRSAADEFSLPLFINARTDLFATADSADHASLLDEAVNLSKVYKAAGGNGFFVPGLMDIDLIAQVCDRVDLPVNIIRLPGVPSTADLKAAGVSRISYGPVVQMEMIEWLKGKAAEALKDNI
jgi:2-methylisocitrate lyase-like PEP mutase family enzyme